MSGTDDLRDKIVRLGEVADAIGKILNTALKSASILAVVFCAAVAYASPIAEADPVRFIVVMAASILLGITVGVVVTLAVSKRIVDDRSAPMTVDEIDRMWNGDAKP